MEVRNIVNDNKYRDIFHKIDLGTVYRRFRKWEDKQIDISLENGRPDKPFFKIPYYLWLVEEAKNYAMPFLYEVGDLVRHNGKYCIYEGAESKTTYREATVFIQEEMCFRSVYIMCAPRLAGYKEASGKSYVDDAECFHPADIPEDIFKLACSKAMECPMLKNKI